MKTHIPSLDDLYSKLIRLYPAAFREEFGEEMADSFRESVEEAGAEGILPLALVCLREIACLPVSLIREFRYEFGRKGNVMRVDQGSAADSVSGVVRNRWDASLGTLPFLLAGLLFMVIKFNLPFHLGYPMVIFLAICLFGLGIGLFKGVPRWTFSYLGWSVMISVWWTMMPLFTFIPLYDPKTMPDRMGGLAWIPLLIALGLGLVMGRSAHPFRNLTSAIWHDWTLLSLSIYSFAAFTLLIYDENHHPYLPAFMGVSTLAICLAVWGFLQSGSSWKRVVSLLTGFVIALVLSNISYATWDSAAYYGLPPSPPQPWYTAAFAGVLGWTIFWSGIMFWPLLIGLVRHVVSSRGKPGMA